MHTSMSLDLDACMYDAYIYDPWSWCMYVWCGKFCSERTDKAILGVWYGYDAHIYDAFSHDFDPDTCMYDAYIYVPRSLILIHMCIMHIEMILGLDPEMCLYVWCIYDSGPWSWMYDAWNNASFPWFVYIWCFLNHICVMHRCMMHIAQIYIWFCYVYMLYIWCGTFWGRTDERTNGRTKRF